MRYRILAVAAATAVVGVASADFVLFITGESNGRIAYVMFEGQVDTKNSAEFLTVRHKKYGDVILPRSDCKWFKAEDPRKKQAAALKAAAKKEDVDQLWKLAKDAIRHGSPGNYFKAAEIIGTLDPDHKEAARARRLAAIIDTEIPESEDEVVKMKKDAKIESKLKAERTQHYLLMHNIQSRKTLAGKKATPIEDRIEVMEKVYRAYLAFFWSRGVELEPPKERLRVVLLNTEQEFKEYAASVDPAAVMSSGFFKLKDNVSYFYEHRNTSFFKSTTAINRKLKDYGKNNMIANRGDLVRLGKAYDVSDEVDCDQSDIKVCTHEMTHQLAGNTKLMPTNRLFPHWAAEGFACYFESPRDVQWSGIGAVNEERLQFYRAALKKRRESCTIEYVVSDKIFKEAKTFGDMLIAYSVSWALTHYLMEKHFDRLIAYYQKIAKLPPFEEPLKPEESLKIFYSCFTGEQKGTLDAQWHTYMQGLRTDLEVFLDRSILRDDGAGD